MLPLSVRRSLDATKSNDEAVASAHQYAMIPELLDELLGQSNLNEDMKRHSAEYFDQHLHPIEIGQQLHHIVLTGYRNQTSLGLQSKCVAL